MKTPFVAMQWREDGYRCLVSDGVDLWPTKDSGTPFECKYLAPQFKARGEKFTKGLVDRELGVAQQ
jgi:hypothetical protein